MKRFMTVFCLFALLTITTGSAFAFNPHFYVSGTAKWNQPTGDFGNAVDDFTEDIRSGNADATLGGEIDAGIVHRYGQAYLGYNMVKFNNKNDGLEWSGNSRMIAGFRWFIIPSLATAVVPTLGGGISVGRDKATIKNPQDNGILEEIEAANSFGWFAEAGANFRIRPTHLSIQAGVQYHRYNAEFDNAFTDNAKLSISYMSALVGAAYYF
ncbi:MAG: hypothetical protein IPP40_08315 [bacterium]|nr:hypothetical protein [bacterium]